MDYPPEWLGFVNRSWGQYVADGAIVELMHIGSYLGVQDRKRHRVPRTHCGVYVVTGALSQCTRHRDEGWCAAGLPWNELEPLTPAAAEAKAMFWRSR